MVVVNAIVRTTQEAIDALRDALATMEAASRAEPGCEDYTFSVEVSDPRALRITEKWRDVTALRAHMETAHMAEFQQVMGAYPPESLEVTCYEAKEIQPFG
jgi:quinol monooxygenase YgiN